MKALVIGGGITGLAAAHALVKEGAAVTVLERSHVLGGKIVTERSGGLLIEHGPDAFLTLRPAALELCADLGLADDVVPPLAPETVFVWHGRRLVAVPAGTGLGIPTRFGPFLRSSLFSPAEKVRAALEVRVPPLASHDDVAVGTFLRRRFGDAVVDRLAGPLISAIYGAAADELSLDALMPRLREAEARHGSLIRAGLAARPAQTPAMPAVVTLRGGMATLVAALVARLGQAEIVLDAEVSRLERVGARYAAQLGDGRRFIADAVVLTAPAPIAARLLAELAPAAVEGLAAIAYRSTVAVTLAYEARQLPRPLAGHGFVAPDGALPVAACTWSSAKWPGRAPDGMALVRATVRSDALLERGDGDVAEAAHRAMVATLGVRGVPALSRVTRWTRAMPRYTVGHLARLARVEAATEALPGLVLAGAAYRGTGLPDCIAQGQAAAARLLSVARAAA